MFPKTFLWGAATSSHQVEGSNTNNDWWLWEQQGRTTDSSGEAARHYHLFEEDFQLADQLHHNAHRFSIEWSRIEPQQGQFNESEIQHYRQVVTSLRQKGIEPIVTLHHFTNPLWFYQQGGWLNTNSWRWFIQYAEKVVAALGKDVRYWITINEPMVFVYHSYLMGLWPPGSKSVTQCFRATQNLIKAHRGTYRTIKSIYRDQSWPAPQVSFAKNLEVFKVCPRTKNVFCKLGVFLRHRLFNRYFLGQVKGCLDFIGLNFYAREFISNDRKLSFGLLGEKCNVPHGHVDHLNVLSWDSCPEGLFEVLCWLKPLQIPILITENGTCEEEDRFRWEFLAGHLQQAERALAAGIPVIGYLYWSLLDNFEWHHGFGPRFGLVEVDYTDFKRTPRPSAYQFSKVIQSGQVNP